MRLLKIVIAAAAVLAGVVWTAPAMAYGHFVHGRVGVGVYIGPGWGPWYYPPYYYGAYAPYYPYSPYSPYYYGGYGAGPAAPTQYVEQGAQAQQPASGSWYYCNDPQGYYPYVQQCRSGWQRVSPTPPGMQ
jgi:hypothetical protein